MVVSDRCVVAAGSHHEVIPASRGVSRAIRSVVQHALDSEMVSRSGSERLFIERLQRSGGNLLGGDMVMRSSVGRRQEIMVTLMDTKQ